VRSGTPNSRSSVEELWKQFESNPEQLPVSQLPPATVGEFAAKGAAAATKKRKVVEAGPPLSKEEALARFQARKAAAQAGKRQKL